MMCTSDRPCDQLLRADGVVAGRGTFRTTPLDLALRRGDVAALVGPSGSGKTSMLRTLSGVTEPWSGTLDASCRRSVCFQEPRMLPWRSARDNVLFALGRRARLTDRNAADDLLATLGLADLGDRRVEDLSGGQRRRVAIARTLITSTEVLLVDEPFTQLDDEAADLVATSLLGHAASGGAIVVAVHSPSTARTIGARCIPVGPAPT